METKEQREKRIARQKRDQAAGLVGLGIVAVIIAAIASALGSGMKSKNCFVRYFCRAIVIGAIVVISIVIISMAVTLAQG